MAQSRSSCAHLRPTTWLAATVVTALATACVLRPAPAAAPATASARPAVARNAELAPLADPVVTAEPAAPSPPPIVIREGTRVLMFGDSMVTSGLGVSLEEHVAARGGKLVLVSKGSSTTESWNAGRTLPDLIARARPDVVIVALASNELFVPNPRARAADIRGIVKRIGAWPCLWIGPPPWLPEKGIIGVVRENIAPCRFFDSSALVLERQRDGIHPTLEGGKVWAEAVWSGAFATPE